MKKFQSLFTISLTTIALLMFQGCAGPDEPTSGNKEISKSSTGESGHSHDGNDHKHGGDDHKHDGNSHGGHSHGAGPHDGTLADWGGGKYHVEFTVDHDKKEAVVYVLGSDEKSPVPVKSSEVLLIIKEPSFQVKLTASPLEGESDGMSSRFAGTHDNLGKVQEFEGAISAEIDGTPYVADFKEEPHEHAHGHSHGEDDALVWVGETRKHAGTEIKLGHHGKHLHAGEEVEPAVSITKDGKPVENAKVYNSLMSDDGKTVIVKETETVFEPTTEEEPAHYAQGALAIPKDVKKAVIQFRIVLEGAEPETFDVPVNVE